MRPPQLAVRASDGPMFEYACHEGNYAMPSMLKGARLLEAEEAKHAESASTSGGHR